jgi:hypothetical protein
LSVIRKALAMVQLVFVSTNALENFAQHVDVDVSELPLAIAVHNRTETEKHTISILPFLPRVEILLAGSQLSPVYGSFPGHDQDVLVISAAKTIVRETRHMIGTLVSVSSHGRTKCDGFQLHGVAYFTLPMVQGTSTDPLALQPQFDSEKAVQGEGGDWYEISHYGALAIRGCVSFSRLN